MPENNKQQQKRADRLKNNLRTNLQKRKNQARARLKDQEQSPSQETTNGKDQ